MKNLWALLAVYLLCATAQAHEYQVDASHTSVYFGVSHFERSQMRGRFNRIHFKQLRFDAASNQGRLELEVDVDSIDTGSRVLDQIIRSEQLLNSNEFPFIHFRAQQFLFVNKQLQTIEGELTIRGETRPLRLQAKRFQCGQIRLALIQREVCGGEFSTSISRSSYGLTRFLPEVGDQIQIEISVEASPIK